VADALDRHRGALRPVQTVEIVQSVAEERLDLAGDGDSVQLWPHRHLTDAMFIALLEKPA
jgi:16S rRNA (cytosine967-C5)-methyltransferase